MGSWIRYEGPVLEFYSAADRTGIAAGGGNGAHNYAGPAGGGATVPQIAAGAVETGGTFHAARAAFERVFLFIGRWTVSSGRAHWFYCRVLHRRDAPGSVGARGVELFGQREHGVSVDFR